MLTTVQELEEEQASEYGSLIKISQMQLSTLRYIKRSTKSILSFVSKSFDDLFLKQKPINECDSFSFIRWTNWTYLRHQFSKYGRKH